MQKEIRNPGCIFHSTPRIISLPCPLTIGEDDDPTHWSIRKCGMLMLSISGCGFMQANGKRHELPSGTAALIYPSDPEIMYGGSVSSAPWHRIAVMIAFENPDSAVELRQNYGEIFTPDDFHGLTDYCRSFISGPGRLREISPDDGWRICIRLFGFLAGQKNSCCSKNDNASRLTLLAQHLIRNSGSEFNVAGLAAELQVSPGHLAAVFRRDTGISPREFICRERIERAKSLLLNSTLSEKEIAWQLGFGYQQNFCRAFKKIVGVPPGEFAAAEGGRATVR